MLAGSTSYDAIIAAGIAGPQFIKAGIIQKLDKARLPGWKNNEPNLLKVLEGYDPGNQYAVPYMWGSVGITHNVDMVRERLPNADLSSLDRLFLPENAAKSGSPSI